MMISKLMTTCAAVAAIAAWYCYNPPVVVPDYGYVPGAPYVAASEAAIVLDRREPAPRVNNKMGEVEYAGVPGEFVTQPVSVPGVQLAALPVNDELVYSAPNRTVAYYRHGGAPRRVATVPEPSMLELMLVGVVGLICMRRR